MSLGCPTCGAATSVQETRSIPGGLRRRRRCVSTSCDGRLCTLELAAPATMRKWGEPMVFVPLAQLEEVARLLATLGGACFKERPNLTKLGAAGE